jgi:hypothetical protein
MTGMARQPIAFKVFSAGGYLAIHNISGARSYCADEPQLRKTKPARI